MDDPANDAAAIEACSFILDNDSPFYVCIFLCSSSIIYGCGNSVTIQLGALSEVIPRISCYDIRGIRTLRTTCIRTHVSHVQCFINVNRRNINYDF